MRIWGLVAAYAVAGTLAVLLTLARAGGASLPASAPLGSGAAAGPPPWAIVRVAAARQAAVWAVSLATRSLGGFAPRADAALADVFPGLTAPERPPVGARRE